ncbi:MAG: anti-sigma factor [candidate division KSB1 bacterium]|nr:anti-sigma factor [candidate division KSB1 bacterium]MDZ7276342.1 anti-sigma factor [candidate division KSB1 bacterium]MDZ7287705.1 anti-sigma factor [candidate division KSB1 bacterium]MDZ7299955.1 anti-sigma factor [candidate division KSB1 bacterium]MDZ7305716.1 anti-sigma factor [candidate division KSB1 bacterium]
MSDEKTQALADAYVLGALEPEEIAEFDRRLAAGEVAAAEALARAQQLATALPLALPVQSPPPELKHRVLQAAAGEVPPLAATPGGATVRALPVRWFATTAGRTLALAAGLLLIAAGVTSWLLQRRAWHREITTLREEIRQKEAELAQLQLALAMHHELARALHRPRVMLVTLSPTQPNQPGKATVLFDPEAQRAYFVAHDLPSLPQEYDYQLWHIGNAGPVDGGVFNVDQSGDAVLEVRNLPSTGATLTAFAVTREPRGGSVTPTLTQMLLFGKV